MQGHSLGLSKTQQTLQEETAKTHQQEQEPPRAGQQEHRDSEPGHSPVASRRRCAPPPRRIELGAFPELSCGFLAAFRLDPGEALEKLRAAATRKGQRNQHKPRRTAARTAPNAALSLPEHRFEHRSKIASEGPRVEQHRIIEPGREILQNMFGSESQHRSPPPRRTKNITRHRTRAGRQ